MQSRRAPWASLHRVICCSALLGVMACGSAESPDEGAADRPTPSHQPVASTVRFVLEVSAEYPEPVFAVLTNEDGQPGWITVFGGSGRIFLSPRCEIEDCGGSGGVCGASIPVIEDVSASEGRSVEFVWDGATSRVDAEQRCESRVLAPAGEYRARFCFGTGANEGSGPAVPPSITGERCEERTFTLEDAEVRLAI